MSSMTSMASPIKRQTAHDSEMGILIGHASLHNSDVPKVCRLHASLLCL